MATNRRAPRDDDEYEDERETPTFALEEVRAEKPAPTRAHFYPLPNYASDRRYDPRARDKENMVALPYTDGYIERFEQFALPGWVFVELRAGNQIVEGFVHEVKPSGRAPVQAQAAHNPQQQPPQVETNSAHPISAARDVIREAKGLVEDIKGEAPAVAPLTREDVAQIAEQAALKVAEQIKAAQPPAPQPQDPFTLIERTLELQKKLQPPAPPTHTEPELSDKQRLELAAVRELEVIPTLFRTLKDAMGSVERVAEPESWSDKLIGLADKFINNPYVAPTLGAVTGHVLRSVASRIIQQQGAAPGQAAAAQQTTPAQPPASLPVASRPVQPSTEPEPQEETEETFESELGQWIGYMLEDLQQGATVEKSAEDFVSLLNDYAEDNPTEVEQVEQMLTQPPAVVAQFLSMNMPVVAPVVNTPEAHQWLGKLQVEIKSRRPVVITELQATATNNGAHA